MDFTWVGRKTKVPCGRKANYEVMVSVTGNRKADRQKAEWEEHRLCITFGSLAFDHIQSEGYVCMMHTPIAGNSERMYFKFIKPGDSDEGSGIKLSPDRGGGKCIASFSFDNQTEYEVIKAMWQKYYDLKYDKSVKLYYIDGVNPKVEKRWV